VEAQLHARVTWAVDGDEWSASPTRRFATGAINPSTQLDRRLDGPHSRSGRGGEEEKSLPCRESNPGCPNPSLVEYQRFRDPCCLHNHLEDRGSVVFRNVGILS